MKYVAMLFAATTFLAGYIAFDEGRTIRSDLSDLNYCENQRAEVQMDNGNAQILFMLKGQKAAPDDTVIIMHPHQHVDVFYSSLPQAAP